MKLIGALIVTVAVAGCTVFQPRPFQLQTHCGLDRSFIRFDGDYWMAVGPEPLNDGAGNPPDGFGNPFDDGTMQRTGSSTAVFVSSQGVRLELARLPARPNIEPCR